MGHTEKMTPRQNMQRLSILLALFFIKTTTSFPSGDLSNDLCIIPPCGESSFQGPQGCTGTIKLTTEEAVVHSVSSSGGDVKKNNYGVVSSITVEGTCCWRVATKYNHRGTTTDFMGAVTDRNHGAKVKSVKQIEC